MGSGLGFGFWVGFGVGVVMLCRNKHKQKGKGGGNTNKNKGMQGRTPKVSTHIAGTLAFPFTNRITEGNDWSLTHPYPLSKLHIRLN